MKLSKTFSRRARKTFFFIHLWTGLLLGLWFAIVGVTGSSLAWMDELTAFETRIRLGMPSPQAGTATIPISQAVASLKSTHPELNESDLSAMLMPNGRFPFYIFWKLPKSRGQDTWMYVVNPGTGQTYPRLNYTRFWISFIKDLHMRLIAGATGLIANGVLSFLALFMLVSGLWLWWPSNINQLKLRLTLKRSQSLRRTLYDLHNIMGIYLYIPLMLVTITAVVWVVDDVTKGGVVKSIDKRPTAREKDPQVTPNGQLLGADALLKLAKADLPDQKIYYVKLPTSPEEAFWALFTRSNNGLLSNGRIWIDPYSGKTLKIEREIDASLGKKTMVLVEDLHKGIFVGIVSKLIYTLTGLMPLGLLITGVWMWWRKKRFQKGQTSSAQLPETVAI